MKSVFTLIVFIAVAISCFATHNRAGEITYEHVSGLEYRITITTYTKGTAIADRPWLKIRWGDEAAGTEEADLDSLPRINGSGNGELLPEAADVKKNIYVGLHTYSGAGTFEITMEDPNRNAGVLNINNGDSDTPEDEKTSTSVMAIFALKSILVIRPGNNGHNNSIKFLNEPIQDACIFQPWIHNPVAYDEVGGDNLVFSLSPCLGAGATPLVGWESPDNYTDNTTDVFQIDPTNGDITWTTPLVAGEYNIAFVVQEFREGIFVGSVERDMQITVVNCQNIPPVIDPLPDYCVSAGEVLDIHLAVSDPDGAFSDIHVDAFGGPLTSVAHVAEWNPVTHVFHWIPECEEVRASPYIVSFVATDEGNIPLSDVETINITVVAPRVEDPLANAEGNHIDLNWNETPCYDVFPVGDLDDVSYLIYRRNNLYGFVPDECELGVPAYTGYSFIGQTEGASNTSFTDNDVYYGGVYCYMVVTVWPDGAISYASDEFCDTVKKEIPVMTKVSVGVTDIANGIDTIHWSKPTDLDQVLFPGPYKYQLYHGNAFGEPSEMIFETPVFSDLFLGDTTFVDENINTQTQANNYKVGIYSTSLDTLIAFSSEASSVLLELVPGDNEMQLNLDHDVPWTNFEYHIYRKAPGETDFTEIGMSATNTYLDSNLVNNQVYCYKVLVLGSYYAGDVPDPLYNWSQEACGQPYDQTPPCPPVLEVEHECAEQLDELTWHNQQDCAPDVTAYNIYYSPVEGQPLQLIATINTSGDTTYIFTDDEMPVSIAGCFAVTALDSLNLWPDGLLHQNESALSNIVCVDNCPLYFLPNIFSPNGDGLNDLFVPFEYRYVESIDLTIFNRWGNIVFRTNDPDINWNGINMDSSNMSTDGVYYYVVKVNTIRLSGIVTEEFNGTIRLMDGKKPVGSN